MSPPVPACRVLHFVPGFNHGGIETLVLGLMRHIDRAAVRFDFMVDTTADLPEFEEIRDLGGEVFQMERYLSDPRGYHRHFARLLSDGPAPYDCFHAHDPIRGVPLLAIARRRGVSHRIVHSHTDSYRGSRHRHVKPVFAPLASLLATDRVAASEQAGRFMFGAKPYRIVRNGIELERFGHDESAGRAIRAEYGIGEETLVIGHTGRFTFQKNHEFMIAFFAEVVRREPDARLLLVGAGPLMDPIRELVERENLTGSVVFAGLRSDIPACLSAMDAFVMPSHFEGLCISLVEAQANGLPSIGADIIPPEAFMTEALVPRSLDAGARVWAETVIARARAGRYDCAGQFAAIREAGFDIAREATEQAAHYLKGAPGT